MDKWTELAMRVQSIAQAGLAYGENEYDRERYQELRDISAEMLAFATETPVKEVKKYFCSENGYQTPKIDTRAAIFSDGKILLVHEKNGTWSLPGGWCDVDQSVGSNAVKETKEETGLNVYAERLIAVQDWRKHNVCNLPYGVIKIFVLCNVTGGEFVENIETTEIRYFDRNEIPDEIAPEKATLEQINMCFDAYMDENWKVAFD